MPSQQEKEYTVYESAFTSGAVSDEPTGLGLVGCGHRHPVRDLAEVPTDAEAAMIYTRQHWEAFMKAVHAGERCQIDQDIYDYFLDVLPPKFMYAPVELVNGERITAAFGFAEGAMQVIAFWRGEANYFAQQTKVWSNGY
jgi:hypothetical protein